MLVAGSKVQSRRRVDRESWSRCGLGPAGGIGGKATRLPVPASLVLCVLGLPESAVGVLVNVAILVVAGYFVLNGRAASGLAQR